MQKTPPSTPPQKQRSKSPPKSPPRVRTKKQVAAADLNKAEFDRLWAIYRELPEAAVPGFGEAAQRRHAKKEEEELDKEIEHQRKLLAYAAFKAGPGEEAEDLVATFYDRADETLNYLGLDFDLLKDDKLTIMAAYNWKQLFDENDNPSSEEPTAWEVLEEGYANPSRYLVRKVSLIPTGDLDRNDILKDGSKPLPDFPTLLKDKKYKQDIRQHYYIEDGMGKITIPELEELGYDRTELVLLSVWLELHDTDYLARVYDIIDMGKREPLPRLASEIEVLRTIALGVHSKSSPLLLKVFSSANIWNPPLTGIQFIPRMNPEEIGAPNPYISIERIDRKKWPISSSPIVSHYRLTTVGFFPNSYDSALAETWIKYYIILQKRGLYLYVDRDYPSHDAAVRALFRLRHLMPATVAGARETAIRAMPGALPGALAGSIIPTTSPRFAAPKVPESYTRAEAEARWREICAAGTESEQTIAELRVIARGLGLASKATTVKGICKVIQKQYELEFGERARLREFAATSVPTVTEESLEPEEE